MFVRVSLKGLTALFFLFLSQSAFSVGTWQPAPGATQFGACSNEQPPQWIMDDLSSSCPPANAVPGYGYKIDAIYGTGFCNPSTRGNSGIRTCLYNIQPCDAPQVWNALTAQCEIPAPVCEPPEYSPDGVNCAVCSAPNALVNGECINPLECGQFEQYNPFTNNCDQGDCPNTDVQGDKMDDFGNCSCPEGTIQVTNGSSSTSDISCNPKPVCDASNAVGTITDPDTGQSVFTCNPDDLYGDGTQDCGIVNGSVICVSENPCDYSALISDPSKCSNGQFADIDNDGDLDGGDEGNTETPLPPVDPSNTNAASDGAGGLNLSALTSRLDALIAGNANLNASLKAGNEKADTLNNMFGDFAKGFQGELTPVNKGSYDTSGIDAEMAALESEYQTQFNTMRNAFSASFAPLATTTASLPSFSFQWKADTITVDLVRFEEYFTNIGLVIFALAALLSFSIVLRK